MGIRSTRWFVDKATNEKQPYLQHIYIYVYSLRTRSPLAGQGARQKTAIYIYYVHLYVAETSIRTRVSKGNPWKRWIGANKKNVHTWPALPRIDFVNGLNIPGKMPWTNVQAWTYKMKTRRIQNKSKIFLPPWGLAPCASATIMDFFYVAVVRMIPTN